MAHLRAGRDRWRAVLDGPARPEPHSSLAADDSVFSPLPCSSIAWWSLTRAVRSYDHAIELLDADSATAPQGALEHLRTALVHASAAVTVLAPSRSRRIMYALRIAWTAFRRPQPDSASLAQLAPFDSVLVVREAAEQLEKREFFASPRWTDRSSVRVAAEHVRDHVPDPELYEATVRFLWAGHTHTATVRDDVVACAESLALMLDRSLSLWQARVRSSAVGATDGAQGQVPASVLSSADAPAAAAAFTRPAQSQGVDAFFSRAQAGRRRLHS